MHKGNFVVIMNQDAIYPFWQDFIKEKLGKKYINETQITHIWYEKIRDNKTKGKILWMGNHPLYNHVTICIIETDTEIVNGKGRLIVIGKDGLRLA